MISRIHESLSNTIDYIEMLAAYPLRKKCGRRVGSPLVAFYFSEPEKTLAWLKKPAKGSRARF